MRSVMPQGMSLKRVWVRYSQPPSHAKDMNGLLYDGPTHPNKKDKKHKTFFKRKIINRLMNGVGGFLFFFQDYLACIKYQQRMVKANKRVHMDQ